MSTLNYNNSFIENKTKVTINTNGNLKPVEDPVSTEENVNLILLLEKLEADLVTVKEKRASAMALIVERFGKSNPNLDELPKAARDAYTNMKKAHDRLHGTVQYFKAKRRMLVARVNIETAVLEENFTKTEKMERHFELAKEVQERKLAVKLADAKGKAAAHEYKMVLQRLRKGFEKGTLLPVDAIVLINKVLEENT